MGHGSKTSLRHKVFLLEIQQGEGFKRQGSKTNEFDLQSSSSLSTSAVNIGRIVLDGSMIVFYGLVYLKMREGGGGDRCSVPVDVGLYCAVSRTPFT
jgi:hypothetical protein